MSLHERRPFVSLHALDFCFHVTEFIFFRDGTIWYQQYESSEELSDDEHARCITACCFEHEGWSKGISTTALSRPTRYALCL